MTSDEFTVDQIEGMLGNLQNTAGFACNVIQNAASSDVIETLVRDHEIDIEHDGDQGIGKVRRSILQSELSTKSIKKEVATRGDPTKEHEILVPEGVKKDALAALRAGKPVVLYGPTGTGKTTFAKQLALEESIGYTLHTAAPSWTAKDIIGGIEPVYNKEQINYKTELGYVTAAVKRARDFSESYSVVLDEVTRADISKIFGPLYTSIENPHQKIIETDDGEAITLDDDVNIICTMNMSDRTVNQLDNAITRRFAMVELSEYTDTGREKLFSKWMANYLSEIDIETAELQDLFHTDYKWLNEGNEERDLIMQFGPMHYEDVAKFVEEACQDTGVYSDQSNQAVGRAYRTYILPRLLNSASFPQIEQLVEHYETLDDKFPFDLSPAAELARRQLETEQKKLGTAG